MIEQGLKGINDLMQWSIVLPIDVTDKIIKAHELSLDQHKLNVRYLNEKSELNKLFIRLKLLRIQNKLNALANGR